LSSFRPPVLNHAKFRAFSERSLGQGAHDILELQALAGENVRDIVVDSPNFRELPPEKQSRIRQILDVLSKRKR